MTTIVTASDAETLLGLVPRLLGFRPRNSLVLIPFAGSRSLGALRLDLPPDDLADTVSSTAIGMICRIQDCDRIVAVVYTDASSRPHLPGKEMGEALLRRASACGIEMREIFTVAADGWGAPLRDDGARSLRELGAGALKGPELSSGTRLPRVSPDDRASTAQALASLHRALEAICGIRIFSSHPDEDGRTDPAALQAACALDDLPALYERALGWDAARLAPMDAALLAWCLHRPSLRDIALVQWASDVHGGDAAADAQRRWEDGEEYPAELAAAMWGEGVRPDVARLERALALARAVAARAPRDMRAGALSVCAWLSWGLGRSTHAERYAARAEKDEPGHGLSSIVRSFVSVGHLPEWAFSAPR